VFLEFYGSGSKSKLEQFGVGSLKKNPNPGSLLGLVSKNTEAQF
jgi:hypothetical protein